MVYGALHGMKKGIKDMVAPQGLFEDLGLKYLGPIDGHDEQAVEAALGRAKSFDGPVLVHVLTTKGKGYDHASNDDADRFHAVDRINPETGLPLQVKGRIWTDEFSDALLGVSRERDDVVAITAAMLIPTGLKEFAERHPDRVFDVGIAEQHAVTMASGLAFGGLHPVVCVYATFLNRAFDQLLMDCALHRAGVTFVLDRAGITGTDGASHNGMWDMSITGLVPGLRLTAPRDPEQLGRAFREAVDVHDGPTVIRFSKQNPPAPLPAVRAVGSVDVLAEATSRAGRAAHRGPRRDGDHGHGGRREARPRRGIRSAWSTRGGAYRFPTTSSTWPARRAPWRCSRTTSSSAASGRRSRPRSGRRGCRCRSTCTGSRSGSCRTRPGARSSRRSA